MKETLLDVKERLRLQLNYIAGEDIHVMPDEDIPSSSRFPCIGLKDGDELWSHVGGTLNSAAPEGERGEFNKALEFEVFAFVQIFRDDGENIIGDGEDKGILEFAADITTKLNGHDLGDSYTAPVIIRRSEKSLVYVSKNEEEGEDEVYIQAKKIIFTCSKQVFA